MLILPVSYSSRVKGSLATLSRRRVWFGSIVPCVSTMSMRHSYRWTLMKSCRWRMEMLTTREKRRNPTLPSSPCCWDLKLLRNTLTVLYCFGTCFNMANRRRQVGVRIGLERASFCSIGSDSLQVSSVIIIIIYIYIVGTK